jgi:hypothetical protein
MEPWRLTLKPWRMTMEIWKLKMERWKSEYRSRFVYLKGGSGSASKWKAGSGSGFGSKDHGKLIPVKSEKSDPDPALHRSKKPDYTAKILYENSKHIFPEMEQRDHTVPIPTFMFLFIYCHDQPAYYAAGK